MIKRSLIMNNDVATIFCLKFREEYSIWCGYHFYIVIYKTRKSLLRKFVAASYWSTSLSCDVTDDTLSVNRISGYKCIYIQVVNVPRNILAGLLVSRKGKGSRVLLTGRGGFEEHRKTRKSRNGASGKDLSRTNATRHRGGEKNRYRAARIWI